MKKMFALTISDRTFQTQWVFLLECFEFWKPFPNCIHASFFFLCSCSSDHYRLRITENQVLYCVAFLRKIWLACWTLNVFPCNANEHALFETQFVISLVCLLLIKNKWDYYKILVFRSITSIVFFVNSLFNDEIL